MVIEVNNPLQLELLLVKSRASSELAEEEICFFYNNQVKLFSKMKSANAKDLNLISTG